MDNKLQAIISSEPVSENQIIKSALTGTLVKSAIPYEIDGAVSVAVDKAIFYLGLKTAEQDRDMIKVAVIDDVRRHFQLLTIEEIKVAIENGSKGLYGKVVGLSPKDVFDWLTAYMQSELRKKHIADIAKMDQPTPEPTEEQKRQLRWVNMINAWEVYKKDGSFNDVGNAVYMTLFNNGKITYSDEQMADFSRLAKADLVKQYNPLNHVGNFVKANECRVIIEEIQTGGDANARVVVAAKKIALNHFFSELAEMEIDIKDLFD